jgi:hypothetical protein
LNPRWAQELDDLPADLQLAQVAMQAEPVQAVQVEGDVPVEHLVDRDHMLMPRT